MTDSRQEIPVNKPRRTRRALLLVLAIVAVQGGYPIWQALRPEPLKPLADFVIARGRQQQIIPQLAQLLGIPLKDLTCHCLSVESKCGRARSLQVRQRPGTSYVDIIFSAIAPGKTETYYYLTSPFGKLVKSIHMTTEPQLVENADERFHKEWDFQQSWQRETMKLDQP